MGGVGRVEALGRSHLGPADRHSAGQHQPLPHGHVAARGPGDILGSAGSWSGQAGRFKYLN